MKEVVRGVLKSLWVQGKERSMPISQQFVFLLRSFVATDIFPSWLFLFILFFGSPLLWHAGAIVTVLRLLLWSGALY